MTWWYELSVSVTYEDCGDEEIFAIKGGSLRRSLHDFAWCVRPSRAGSTTILIMMVYLPFRLTETLGHRRGNDLVDLS